MEEIPEIKLVPTPETPEAKKVLGHKWASPDIGHRHKLGGKPDWIQGDESPTCPTCFQEMTFYAQLDSIGDDLHLGDCGLIYVFVCFNCSSVSSVFQCS